MNDKSNANLPAIAVSRGINLFDSEQFNTLQRVCKAFASSDLVPDIYRTTEKNPESKAIANCMIAIDMAQRLSANPLMIMQNLYVVQGKPSWSSTFLISTVNTCGRFEPLQFTFKELGKIGKLDYVEYEKKWVEGTQNRKGYYKNEAVQKQFDGSHLVDISCVAFTSVKGSSAKLESTEVTIRMAIQEGWYTKPGSKWPTMTKQMLMYRAAAFWVRSYAPELSMGMRTIEEYQDIDDQTPEWQEGTVQQEIRENANGKPISIEVEKKDAPAEQPANPAPQPEPEPEPVQQEQPLGAAEERPLFMQQD